jgi:hypothetical protein
MKQSYESLVKENRKLRLEIAKMAIERLNDNTDMHLRVVTHHRDQLLTEIKELKKLLRKK